MKEDSQKISKNDTNKIDSQKNVVGKREETKDQNNLSNNGNL